MRSKAPHRVAVSLACSLCSARNYRTTRQVKQTEHPLELKKFCAACNQHTLHRETK
ncbi:MAG: 50S ribosomal protein L33 [Planctomycetes bacterium]|nr:50S ribosomal protein L33 [Planctomycetota bacterium]